MYLSTAEAAPCGRSDSGEGESIDLDGLSWSVLVTAALIAFTHTILGPDHYLPFIMIARARGWSGGRTAAVTALCGVGHVLTSVLLGTLGLALGVALARMQRLEWVRGSLAAWALVAFGLTSGAWGARRALRRSRRIEPHVHGGAVHVHSRGDLPHVHGTAKGVASDSPVTFWALLAIFVLGPCEPLIPLFMLPASRGRWELALLATVVFGVVTVLAMVSMTVLVGAGLRRMRLAPLERWADALAGIVIAVSGLAVIFLGL